MKLIHCLFAIYLIVISCLPCADVETSSLSHSSIITSTTDNHSDKTNDSCSPFCVCNCCSTPVFIYNSPYNFSPIKSIILDVKVPEYKSIFTSNYSGSIWQPPQINS